MIIIYLIHKIERKQKKKKGEQTYNELLSFSLVYTMVVHLTDKIVKLFSLSSVYT